MFIMFGNHCIRIDSIVSVSMTQCNQAIKIITKFESFSMPFKKKDEMEQEYKRITDILLALKAD